MCDPIIKKLLSLWTSKKFQISSLVFNLTTIFTFFMLLLFVLLIIGNHVFGEPTSCTTLSGKVDYVDIYYRCWINGRSIGRTSIMHDYIWYLLLIQMCFVAIPITAWYDNKKKLIPKSLKKLLTAEFNEAWINQRRQLIDFIKNNPKSHHQELAANYIVCQFFSIVCILISMICLHFMFGDFFNVYQLAASAFLLLDFPRFYQESSVLFPKEGACSYRSFENFKLTTIDVTCTFPQNSLNDKIFAILYIWYIFILTWSVLHFIVLVVLYSSKSLRLKQIRHMIGRPSTTCECKYLSENGDYGLWFTLRFIRRNLHLAHFQDLCTGLLSEATCPANP